MTAGKSDFAKNRLKTQKDNKPSERNQWSDKVFFGQVLTGVFLITNSLKDRMDVYFSTESIMKEPRCLNFSFELWGVDKKFLNKKMLRKHKVDNHLLKIKQ